MTRIKINYSRSRDWNLSSSEDLAEIDELIRSLQGLRYSASFSSPPAELVLSSLKEQLLFGISFFGQEFRDVAKRSPELKIVNVKEIFHSHDGTFERDTGFQKSIYIERRPVRVHLKNEALQEFLTNVFEDLIDIEDMLLKGNIPLDFEDLEKILESRRRESTICRSDSSRIKSLENKIKKLESAIFSLRRRLKRATRNSRK
jgi:hypothetical protein